MAELDYDEADRLIRNCKTYNFGMWAADKLAHEVAPALLDRVRELEAERDEGLTFVRKWSKANARWRRLARGTIRKLTAERDAALSTIAKVREAVSGHPECDRYEDGDAITCGWKNAYASVVRALGSVPSTGEGSE